MANAALLTPTRTRTFIDQQNLIRGAFAQRRKRSFNENATMSPILSFRTSMRRALMKARAALDTAEYADFLDWHTRQHLAEFPGNSEGPVGFDYLNGVIEGPIIPLSKELMWLIARLLQHVDLLAAFRGRARPLDELCVDGRYRDAIDALTGITESYGESMWSVQLRIALEHKGFGLEAQKAYYETVRGQYRRGILSYVAYHTSVLNEDRTTWQRFSETISRDSQKRKDRALADYFQYRLLNTWPENQASIASVLRIEQSHSIIDQYETFVSFCQDVSARPYHSELKNAVAAACHALGGVGDFRLKNIASSMDQFGELSSELAAAAEALAAQGQRYNSFGNEGSGEADPWSVIAAAYTHRDASKQGGAGQQKLFYENLSRFIWSNGHTTTIVGELEKLCHTFRGIPIAKGVLAFVRGFYPSNENRPFRFSLVDLNSSRQDRDEGIIFATSIVHGDTERDERERMLAALESFREENYQAALDALEGVRDSAYEPLGRLIRLIWLWSADAIGDHTRVIASLSSLGSRDPSEIPLLPIERMIGLLPTAVYKKLGDELAPLNALNMLWKSTEADRVASTLRLMTGQFLRRPDIGPPSTLIEQSGRFGRDELIYFLREVCVPSVLDVSRVFSSSQAVQEERQAICGALNTLDPENSSHYSDEVLAIARRLKVDEGLRIVDQSRVHVDTDAVTRWAHRTLAEDFDRYNDLARAGIGASGNFDDALRELKDSIRHSKQGEFFTPQNEADNALIRLLRSVREEFLNSSAYGLDYFLSKRIRHVSFIGLVRGPLEFAHLISTKPTANSAYGSNTFWLDRLETLDSIDREAVDEAIKIFSEKFDDALNQLKSQILHVRSAERPDGIFDIPLTTTLLVIGRALLQDNPSFDEFLQLTYIIFWAALEPSLQDAREIIDGELKMGIAHHIDELKATIALYAQHDPAFPELSAALAQASSGVQAALSDASSWFTRPEIREATRYFSLEEALDVAIESALKLHRAFTPTINRTVKGEISLSAPDLVFITDAVLVAFSNIKSYSKLDNPKVDILLRLDEAKEILEVEIENDVSTRARSPQQDARIEEIASVVAQGVKNQRTNMEGGSGFIKLAAVVQQSTRGRIEFGYTEPTTFKLSVAYSILIGPTFLEGVT